MSDIDYTALDGRSLRLFLAVLEEKSVTAAAERLGVTQSAVSHTLEKLRAIMQDPLFVKSGRGIVATAHAQALAERAQTLLDDMKAFTAGARFEPAGTTALFTVAANDFQRDLLLPGFFRGARRAAPGVRLRVIPSGAPSADLLRENRCDLVITPIPPTGADIIQKRLLRDRFACFYDPRARAAPASLADYVAARHVAVVFDNYDKLEFDKALDAHGIRRADVVTVANFSGVPVFLRGTDLLATVPSLLRTELMREFAIADYAFAGGDLADHTELRMYMVWHRRNHLDPAHCWLRATLEEVAQATVGQITGDAA